MAKIITYVNEDGGVGKTSILFNSSWEMSKKHRILMIDMDGQKGNLSFFCGKKTREDQMTMFDVLMRGKSIKEAIVPIKENLDIIPANSDVVNIMQSAKTSTMKKAFAEIQDDYDYIFIDTNPNPDWRHFLAMVVSDYLMIVMLPDPKALESSLGIIESYTEAKEVNPRLMVLGMVFNKFNSRTVIGKSIADEANRLMARLNSKVFTSSIRQDIAMSEAVTVKIGVTEYSPKSRASEDIKKYIKEFEREVNING